MLNTGKSVKTGFDLGEAVEFVRQRLPQDQQIDENQIAYVLKYIYFYISVSEGGIQSGDTPENDNYYDWGLAEGITKTDIEQIATIISEKGVDATYSLVENIYTASLEASMTQNLIKSSELDNFRIKDYGEPLVELTESSSVNRGMNFDQLFGQVRTVEIIPTMTNSQFVANKSNTEVFPSSPPPKKFSMRSVILIVSIAVTLLFCTVAVGLISIKTYSAIKNSSSTQLSSNEEIKQITSQYYTQEEKNKLLEIIDTATTLEQLEKNVNEGLMVNSYFIESQGGRYPAKIALTEETAALYDNRTIYKSMYTTLTEEDLPSSKIAVARFIAEYMRYPVQISSGFMDSVIFAKNITPDPLAATLMAGGITNTRVILYSVYDLSIDSEYGIDYAVTTINHEAWHQHDLISLLNLSVDLTVLNNLSSKESIVEASETVYGEWEKINLKAEKPYSDTAFSNELFNYVEYPYKGYVTGYSMRNVVEDRAEVFSHLMSTSKKEELLEKASSDEVLQKKINIIYDNLRSYGIDPDTDLFNRSIL